MSTVTGKVLGRYNFLIRGIQTVFIGLSHKDLVPVNQQSFFN